MLFRFFLFALFLSTPLSSLANTEEAVFAGGCFWCMEPPFDALKGVKSTTSGYIGGEKDGANYERVSSGQTEHVEAVQVAYDPDTIAYEELLKVFWRNIDPFDRAGQFCDKGPQYRSVLYYGSEEERKAAEQSKQEMGKILGGKKIVTPILPKQEFFPAEEYHQDYYKKNSLKYKFYRYSCGRDKRLESIWGDVEH